jgi:3-oxoadipate enol-lactonase
MPAFESNGTCINYELNHSQGRPVILLSNSLGTNLAMWEPQIEMLTANFSVLRYDTRGHGQSRVNVGPYTIEQLGRDVLALLDHLSLREVHFCGLSMGGLIGMWLGINSPERVSKVILCSTAARIGSPETWAARIDAVSKKGMQGIAASVMDRWFTPLFRTREISTVRRIQEMLEQTNPQGYMACCEAIRDCDMRASVAKIRASTLIISATHDPATPPADGRFLAETIRGASYAEVQASHLCNVEAANNFNSKLHAFLEPQGA